LKSAHTEIKDLKSIRISTCKKNERGMATFLPWQTPLTANRDRAAMVLLGTRIFEYSHAQV
jgi:hypothetical protein